MDFQLRNRRALVMGASAGLGRAIAQALVQEGAQVAICSRDETRIQKAAQEMGATWGIAADLSVPGAAGQVVRAVVEKWGSVDILVNNTGGPPKGTFLELTPTQWKAGFDGLWMSAVEAIQAALPAMKQNQWGRILLVTSFAAKEPMASLTISNGLRAGLTGLAKSLSNEVAADGITVNCLLPGYTDTERLKELGLSAEKISALVPTRRLGRPEELAAVAAFLASEQAAYVTGQSIVVDGGALRGH